MTVNTAANAAMQSQIGANTGTGGPSTARRFALGQTMLDVYGNVWIYGKNGTGSTITAGQVAISYAGAITTGNGAVSDKDIPDGYYYLVRNLEGGIGLEQDLVPTIAFAAGAANVCTVTITWKDRAGNTVKGVRQFDVFLSDSSAGAGLAATGASAELVATTGSSIATVTSHKRWTVQSASTGIFVGSLTDTVKSPYYIAVIDPQAGLPVVSASATVTGSFG